ncbi:universal stress protein [Roseomonas xinghualingensis]|uniref:universal stress protein n=1 Tax=Roseomonas xinghualingensis TaxID=2986475 RepID=UPI0021F11100|nr:universal stress protein [Roseomonas sp. SXEYE001]MCV4209624.1 universal stress protein [Roseomonas sp. SXEYE001]
MWDSKALLVLVEPERSSEARIRLAADLADRFDCTLIGLASGTAKAADELRVAEERFHTVSRKAAPIREWRSFIAPPAEARLGEARAADLLILGWNRRTAAGPPAEFRKFRLRKLLGQAGRPILLVPDGLGVLDASRILVAWSDTQAARRAITAALPLLRLAQQVQLVDALNGVEDGVSRRSLSDITRYLLRHDVPAEEMHSTQPNGLTPGHILRIAQRLGADLIVSGVDGASGCRAVALENQVNPARHFKECWLLSR